MAMRAVDVSMVKIGDWVKINGYDQTSGKVFKILEDSFYADLLTDDNNIECIPMPILLSRIREIITDPKKIEKLECMYYQKWRLGDGSDY